MTIIRSGILRSIMILTGIIMLSACKNDINQVQALSQQFENLPEVSGVDLVMIYSDSARIKYKIITSNYIRVSDGDESYDEFPSGIRVISYGDTGQIVGKLFSKYAIKRDKENAWEARDSVVVENASGSKLETELMFWDMENELIYSPRYSRLTQEGNIIEGNNGFESDQNLTNPRFKNVTGQFEVIQE